MSHVPKNIVILAATGSSNLGDELIIDAELGYLSDRFPHANISIATHDRLAGLGEHTGVQYFQYFPSGIRKHPFRNVCYFFSNLKKLISADLLVVGGGGIFFDNEPGISFQKVLKQWSWRLRIARIFGARVVFFGISLEVENPDNQEKLKTLFATDDVILMRDQASKDILDRLSITASIVSDSAFLTWVQERSPISTRSPKKVGIALRWGFLQLASSEIVEFVSTLAENYEILFLSHSTAGDIAHDDVAFVRWLFWDRFHITESIEETFAAYWSIDFLIGMRFHSILLASAYGIPTLPILYGPKVASLVSELGIEQYAVTLDTIDVSILHDRWTKLTEHADDESVRLSAVYSATAIKLLQYLDTIDIV